MSKFKTLVLVILLAVPMLTSAQEKGSLIKTSLLFPFSENLLVAYEKMIGESSSIQLEVVVGNMLSIRPEYRFYMSETKTAPSGAYVAPFVHLVEETAGAGLMIGYQRLFKSKISLEAFIGPGVYGEGVRPWGGVNVGLAF